MAISKRKEKEQAMKYWVEFITQDEWKEYSQYTYDYGQYLAACEDYQKEEFAEMKQAYWCDHGEELTWRQYEKLSNFKCNDMDPPEYPTGHNEFCKCKKSAQEFAFLKNLEGCKTRIFYSPGKDDDGDELWEEI